MHREAHHGMLKFVQVRKVKYLYGREKEGLCLKEQPRLESRTPLTMNSKYSGETHAGPHVKSVSGCISCHDHSRPVNLGCRHMSA